MSKRKDRKRERKAMEELLANAARLSPNEAYDHVVYFTVEEVGEALCRCFPGRTQHLKPGELNIVFTGDFIRLRQRVSGQR